MYEVVERHVLHAQSGAANAQVRRRTRNHVYVDAHARQLRHMHLVERELLVYVQVSARSVNMTHSTRERLAITHTHTHT